jgi:hypothetical protein
VIQEWDKVSTDVVTIRDNTPGSLTSAIAHAEAARV